MHNNFIENEIEDWETIKVKYPDEWVVIGNPIFEGMKLLEGTVISHHSDKRVASIEGGEKREGFNKFTVVYTGNMKSNYHIGLLRTIHKSK
jgi:hypothetical protein